MPSESEWKSIWNLQTHRERDCRARTLTTLLGALNYRISNAAVDPNPILVPYTSPETTGLGYKEQASDDKGSRTLLRSMKLLNMMAQLFVRHHEILAVIPKRSGPNANLSMVISTDSASSGDETEVHAGREGPKEEPAWQEPKKQKKDSEKQRNEGKPAEEGTRAHEGMQGHGEDAEIRYNPIGSSTHYLIARNPRLASPSTPSSPALDGLRVVTNMEQLAIYLHRHAQVPFAIHVACIELLLNRIIASCRLPTSRANTNKELEEQMLIRYITFRAAPKMHRRFKSPEFQKFLTVMQGLTPQDICGVFPFEEGHELDRLDTAILANILYYTDLKRECYPELMRMYDMTDDPVLYSKATAWEFHQLFLFVLHEAIKEVEWLQQNTKTQPCETAFDEVRKHLPRAEHWMGYLNILIHHTDLIYLHMQALEPLFASLKPPLRATLITPSRSSDEQEGSVQEMVEDDGISDIELELAPAALCNRAAQQCLWLSVSVQYAIHCLTDTDALPQGRITLTLLDAPAMGKDERTMLDDWESVIRTIYSISNNSSNVSDNDDEPNQPGTIITPEEAVATLREYGSNHRGRYGKFLEDKGSSYGFTGRWHAEAFLATLRSLSLPGSTDVDSSQLPGIQNFHKIRNTYGHIGVSKRCCPMCTKVISLLFPESTKSGSHNPPMILSGHQNVYPTALPPFLPEQVATQFLSWLQHLVRGAVDRLVLKRRRASVESQGSAKGANSKRDSPDGKNKDKMRVVSRMRGLQVGSARDHQISGDDNTASVGEQCKEWGFDE